jgi:Dolichyl-phosphate-mannose-protein mannosyltransferase
LEHCVACGAALPSPEPRTQATAVAPAVYPEMTEASPQAAANVPHWPSLSAVTPQAVDETPTKGALADDAPARPDISIPTYPWLRPLLTVAAGAAATYELATKETGAGFILAAIACAVLFVPRLPLVSPRIVVGPSVRLPMLVASLLLCLVVDGLAFRETRGLLPVIPWVLSLVAGVFAFRDSGASSWDSLDRKIAGAFFVGALISRTALLNDWPPFIHGDEADWALLAQRMWNGEVPPFAFVWLGYPGTSFLPYSLTLGILGMNLVAVRLASGLVGALAIPAIYLTGKQAFGRLTGLLAALLLLLNIANIHFSRMGLPNVEAVPLIIIGAGSLLAVASRPARYRQWAILGLTLGLSVDAYLPALVWPLIAVIALVPPLVILFRSRVPLGPGLAALVIVGFLAASPLIVYSLRHPETIGARGNSLAIYNPEGAKHARDSFGIKPDDPLGIWRVQLQRSLEAIQSRGDSSLQFGADRGYLDPIAAFAFVVGLVALARQWRRPAALLLYVWFALSLFFGSVILIDPPFAPRLVVLVPALCLIAAVGFTTFWASVLVGLRQRRFMVASAAIACVLVGSALNLAYYFGDYRANHPNEGITALAWYVQSIQGQRTAYFVGLDEPNDYVTLVFMAPKAKVLRWNLTDQSPPPPDLPALSFLMPASGDVGQRAKALVTSRFPTGRERFLVNTVGQPIIRLWEVPPDDSVRPAEADQSGWNPINVIRQLFATLGNLLRLHPPAT